MSECGKDVFPDHPEWDVKCNQDEGHETVCARFDLLPAPSVQQQAREDVRQMWNTAFGHNP